MQHKMLTKFNSLEQKIIYILLLQFLVINTEESLGMSPSLSFQSHKVQWTQGAKRHVPVITRPDTSDRGVLLYNEVSWGRKDFSLCILTMK